MQGGEEYVWCVSVACDPQRGWVTVMGQRSAQLEYPVIELTLFSLDGQKLASTLIVDAPEEFRMTLHPRGASPGMSLVLRLEMFRGDASFVVREYNFQFVADEATEGTF